MRLFLISSLLLLSMEQANAAHYNFSQLFDPGSGSSVVGSFDVAATSGIVNESQISNFYFSPVIGWGSNETDRRITFNLDTKQLDIFLRTVDVYQSTDPESDPENPQFIEVIKMHSYFADATGGSESYSCDTVPFAPISECSHLSHVQVFTSEPVNVKLETPLPGALGLFSLGLAVAGLVNRRSGKSKIAKV